MNDPERDVIVLEPGSPPSLLEKVKAAVEREGGAPLPRRLRWKFFIGGLLHVVGIHHWARLRQYDPASDRIIETGDWVCAMPHCPAVRHG